MTNPIQFPTQIGTPLAANALKVMLLGSGELGKEVIIAFQRLGVEVIAVDRYPNAPGHQVAHRFHVVDMTNANALKALIAQERPHIVVPEIEAIATPALKELEAQCRVVDNEPGRHSPFGGGGIEFKLLALRVCRRL